MTAAQAGGKVMTTSSEIDAAIKAKYSGPEWRVWFEVSQGTGSFSGRRADAVVMNIWPSKRYQLHVFEVKVSRADFKHEFTSLEKSEAIGKYADFFWLAVPAGLVSVAEVPEAWGVMEMTKGGLRIKKQAPARAAPSPIDRAFAASLLRSGQDLTEEAIQRRVDERTGDALEAIRKASDAKHEAMIAREKSRNDAFSVWKADFETTYGVRPGLTLTGQEMADRIALATRLGGHQIQDLARQARGLAELISRIVPGAAPIGPNLST
jgi:hypothetical protein